MEAWWNGDEWRWHYFNAPAAGPRYIDVIEPPSDQERPADPGARRVPFGFSRVLLEETEQASAAQRSGGERDPVGDSVTTAAPAEPLGWDGDDA